MYTFLKFGLLASVCSAVSAASNSDCSNLLVPDQRVSLHQSYLAMAVLKKINKNNIRTYGKKAGATLPFSDFVVTGNYEVDSRNISNLSDFYSFDMTHDQADGILQTSLSKVVVEGFVKCKQIEKDKPIAIWLTDRSADSVVLNYRWNAPGGNAPSTEITFHTSGGSKEKGVADSSFSTTVGFKTEGSILIYRQVGAPLKIVANQANYSDSVSLPGKVTKLKLMDTKAFIFDKYPVTAPNGGAVVDGKSVTPDKGYIFLPDTIKPHFSCKEGDPNRNCHLKSKAWQESASPWVVTIKGRAYPTSRKGTYVSVWASGIQQRYERVDENF